MIIKGYLTRSIFILCTPCSISLRQLNTNYIMTYTPAQSEKGPVEAQLSQ